MKSLLNSKPNSGFNDTINQQFFAVLTTYLTPTQYGELSPLLAPKPENDDLVHEQRKAATVRMLCAMGAVGAIDTGVDIVLACDPPVTLCSGAAFGDWELAFSSDARPVVYAMRDIDMTETGLYSVALREGSTLVVDKVVVVHKEIDNWTASPSGEFAIGFADVTNIPGTKADWKDNYSETVDALTDTHILSDTDTKSSAVYGDTALFAELGTAHTADALVADVLVFGYEY